MMGSGEQGLFWMFELRYFVLKENKNSTIFLASRNINKSLNLVKLQLIDVSWHIKDE